MQLCVDEKRGWDWPNGTTLSVCDTLRNAALRSPRSAVSQGNSVKEKSVWSAHLVSVKRTSPANGVSRCRTGCAVNASLEPRLTSGHLVGDHERGGLVQTARGVAYAVGWHLVYLGHLGCGTVRAGNQGRGMSLPPPRRRNFQPSRSRMKV